MNLLFKIITQGGIVYIRAMRCENGKLYLDLSIIARYFNQCPKWMIENATGMFGDFCTNCPDFMEKAWAIEYHDMLKLLESSKPHADELYELFTMGLVARFYPAKCIHNPFQFVCFLIAKGSRSND